MSSLRTWSIALMGAIMMVAHPARAEPPKGDVEAGLRYADAVCSECHGVRPDEASRMPKVATFVEIANSPGMTGTAIAVWLQTPHRAMPNLMLEAEDRANVIAYIMTLKK
jgi:mono/diheme cytochrome c family protein